MTDAPILCIFGQRGYGKSTLARPLVERDARLLAYDLQREHDCLPLDYRGFCEYLDALPALDTFRVGLTEIGEEEHFAAIAWELAGRLEGRGLTFFLEEAQHVAPNRAEPPIVKRLIAEGRHWAVKIVACSRRPSEMSRLLSSQAEEIFVFRTHEPDDLTYLRAFLSREHVDELPHFARFEYLHWTVAGVEKKILPPPGGTASSSGGSESENP